MFKIILGAVIAALVIAALISLYPVVGIILAFVVILAAIVFILVKKDKIKFKKSENSSINTSTSDSKTSKTNVNNEVSEQERLERRQQFLVQQHEKFNSELLAIERFPIELNNKEIKKRPLAEMPELNFYKITRKTNIDSLFPLIVIDVETTGLNCRKNDIIEVSAIKYEADFTPDFCFTTLCKINKPLPEEIIDLTHISDDMLDDAPSFDQIVDSLAEFVKGCNICGYNLEFDLKFLFVNGLDLPSKLKYIDAMELAKAKLKRAPYNSSSYDYDVLDYKLETIAKYYNIYRNNAHRSLSDCYATGKILNCLISEFIE